jgi:beta-lactamase superfamily II metal-dependent hydrolase
MLRIHDNSNGTDPVVISKRPSYGAGEKVMKRRLTVIALMVAAVLVSWWPEVGATKFRPGACDPVLLCVVFLDVGQGDAVFIQSPTGIQMLIDAGRPDNAVLRELGKVMPFSDRSLDYVLMTHPDADHIGGFPEVLARYTVVNVIRTENERDTGIWRATVRAIKEENATVH